MQKSGEENSALKTELEKAHEVVTEKSGMVIDLQGNNNILLSSADNLNINSLDLKNFKNQQTKENLEKGVRALRGYFGPPMR